MKEAFPGVLHCDSGHCSTALCRMLNLCYATKAIRVIPGYSAWVGIAGLFLAVLIVWECCACGKDRGNFREGQS